MGNVATSYRRGLHAKFERLQLPPSKEAAGLLEFRFRGFSDINAVGSTSEECMLITNMQVIVCSNCISYLQVLTALGSHCFL